MTHVKNHRTHFGPALHELFHGFPVNWGRDMHASQTVPPVNIHESSNGYHVELNAAGLTKEAIQVNLEKGLLTISYEHKAEEASKEYQTLRKEFGFQSFKRSFRIDEKIEADGIQAKYENGILKLFLPKKEETQLIPKQIAIQ